MTEADVIVGLSDRETIPRICLSLVGGHPVPEPTYSKVITGPPHTAYLRIAEGCDNRCSYCAIPMIRGEFRSVPEEAIIAEAVELASIGIRELVLVAQDTTNYGADLEGASLPRLLGKLAEVDGISWIRLLYANPAKFTGELTESMASLPQVLPYVDMPVQHISGKVLKRMSRPADPARIRDLVHKLRERIDGIVLRTTLMVGFPGETDGDFRELLDFMETARFERLGAFAYSPEEGTRALDYTDIVPPDLADERLRSVMETQSSISESFQNSLVGREFDMIVDDTDTKAETVTGRTYMDAPEIDGNVIAAGSVKKKQAMVRVKITGAGPYDLNGEIIQP